MPRFAANLGYLFTEHDFLDRFAAARRAGFRAVEFAAPYAYPPEEIAMRLLDNGLECILINLPMGDRAKGDFGIACRPGREAEFRDGVARGIMYAKALGVPKMNCIVGTAGALDDPARLRETLVANLRLASRELGAAGLDLLIEPINTTDVPGFFVSRSPQAVEIIAEVGAANLGLQCDLYHTVMMGDDPARTLESLWSSVRHIQFADAPGRGEPGTGRIDFPPLFALIDRLGYGGWVSAEYRPTRPTPETLSTFLRSSPA
jgi:hydroxypyruvate isomerase